MSALAVSHRAGILGVGYEGRSIDEFVNGLADMGVTRLVDIRMTPISRKRGFSKSALGQALATQGIAYEHRRELGNPKENRPGFGGNPEELRSARAVYASRLEHSESLAALDALAETAQRELVALLCFEADERRCHRQVVIGAIERRMPIVSASTRPAR
ncbi:MULTISPECIES: DUF488 domain-containing protein [unclassified Micromonospora]|uniref:DUF488 domain-containing protein n=1 Tax=unclassified Micromonospora TaxID=2617518 RepID=UPI0022B69575|nr:MULTISPECIES: DUF488 domain-containing protein [unclassified Micromonospora]MCZ7418392.1 DUF488 domain-containing protein [Verrucosispora sp. WMMA2121]WBB92100.1 DUF488 domain-containing protein [Verrucosispora sp. WMMC514]